MIVLGSILVPFWPPKWSPGGARELVVWPVEAIQDGLEIVLVRFFFGLVVRDRFFGSLGLLLGSFLVVWGSSWGRFWVLRVSFWCFFGISIHRFNPSTHQLIDFL